MTFSSFYSSINISNNKTWMLINISIIFNFLAATLDAVCCENCVVMSFDEICVPESQKLMFYLYTRETANKPFQLDFNNIEQAPLLPSTPLKVLIHGYTGWKDYSPNMELRPAYFKTGDYNLLSIDWGPLAVDGCYIAATNNVKPVGQCTARLLEKIVQVRKDVKPEDIHVVGFSLGAHVAGYVGKSLSKFRATRITALDPALPLFDDIFNSDSSVGAGDAEFVDVIHTNGGMKGKSTNVGHVDFHANGGSIQPGCPTTNTSCHHVRAVEIFAESIYSDVGFYGYECPSFIEYMTDCCSKMDSASEDKWVLLGEYVDSRPNVFELEGLEDGFQQLENVWPTNSRGSYYFDTPEKYPLAIGKNCSV